MDTGGLILVIGTLAVATASFIWMALRLGSSAGGASGKQKSVQVVYEEAAKQDVEHIFNDEFREELRNRGRLHFEKIIGEAAMFLQQDLRQTTSQLTEYMRAEVTRTLQQEFKKYEQSIVDAKQMALDSIEKTIHTIDQQREFMEQQMKSETAAQKEKIIAQFEADMASIVNHYVLQAIGSQIDLTDQLDYILREIENNKTAIIEDLKHGT